MKKPDQSIYDHIFRKAQALAPAYPFNPPPETPYPFVQMGNVQVIPRATKSCLMGTAYATLDIWGDGTDRKAVSALASSLLESLGEENETAEGLKIYLDADGSGIEIMTDNSTPQDLWRGRVSLRFNFL